MMHPAPRPRDRARGRRRVLVAALLLVAGCEREQRRFDEGDPAKPPVGYVTQNDQVQPGAAIIDPELRNPYERNAHAIAEGKNLYERMNCAGCHSPRGGGNMGPSLIDSTWIYGAEPENIWATIHEGRPRGMPAFRGRLPAADIWKLVAYVRAMNGLTRQDTRAGRGDEMHEMSPDVQSEPMIPEAQRIPPEEPDPHARPGTARRP